MVKVQFPLVYLETYGHTHPFLTPGLQVEVLFLFLASRPIIIVSLTLTSPRGIGGPPRCLFSTSIFLFSCPQAINLFKNGLFLPRPYLIYFSALLGSSPYTHITHTYWQTQVPHNSNTPRKDSSLPGNHNTAFYFSHLLLWTVLIFHLRLLNFHLPLKS